MSSKQIECKLSFISSLFENIEEGDYIFEYIKTLDIKNPILVDVGAHHGSSILPYIDRGWKIYAFEPDNTNRAHLLETCGNCDNVTIEKLAVSNEDNQEVSFFTSDESTGISGLNSFHDTHEETQKVYTITLESYCKQQNIQHIDFLKIDTEGYDKFVLEGLNFNKVKPKVILTEFEDSKTLRLGYSFQEFAKYLTQKGYHVVVSEWFPIEKYGIQHKWRKFHLYPCTLEDKTGWGNMIAFSDLKDYTDFLNMIDTIAVSKITNKLKTYENKIFNRDEAIERLKNDREKQKVLIHNRDKAILIEKDKNKKKQQKLDNRDDTIARLLNERDKLNILIKNRDAIIQKSKEKK